MTIPRRAAFLLPLLLSACAVGPTKTDGPVGDPVRVPPGVAGIYRLESVNEQALPVLAGSWDDCSERILSAALSLHPDRRFNLSATARQDCAGAAAVESRGGGAKGRYRVEGDTIRFDDATKISGAAERGWVEDYPSRMLAVEDLGGVGTLDGEVLTIRLEDGRIATFRKS